jgi:hypothetical protein
MLLAAAMATLREWGWAVAAGLGGSLLGFAVTAAVARRDVDHEKDE